MSGPKSDSERPDPANLDEEYDEELAALSAPPPSLRHAVIICVILVLSAYMLYFFFPDLSYLLRGLEEPEDLGEAADILPEKLEFNSYVTIHGLPMMHHSVEFKEGFKWFALSDTTRNLFPLTGQPRLFVQWTEPEERRAYRDPNVNPERLALPYDFTGHLLDRSAVGGNYGKIWTFYDCLAVYSLRQCKHCLGLTEMAACRERFICAESFPADECAAMLDPGAGAQAAHRDELDELIAKTERDELARRVQALIDAIAERRKRVEQVERELEQIETGEMKQTLEQGIADLEQRNADADRERRELEARVRGLGIELDKLRGEVKRLQDEVSLAGSDIAGLTRKATALKADLEALAVGDGATETAEAIQTRIRDELSGLKAAERPDGGPVLAADAGASGDAGPAADEDAERAQRVAELEADLAALDAGTLAERRQGQLTAIKERLAGLDELQQARKKELTAREELAERLAELPREARERADKIEELRRNLAALGSGAMKEEKRAIASSLKPELERMKKLEPRVTELAAELEPLAPGAVGGIESKIDELEDLLGPPTWILVDGETPGDKIWVVAVYVVFLVMIGFNLRRLYRFWIAWRS